MCCVGPDTNLLHSLLTSNSCCKIMRWHFTSVQTAISAGWSCDWWVRWHLNLEDHVTIVLSKFVSLKQQYAGYKTHYCCSECITEPWSADEVGCLEVECFVYTLWKWCECVWDTHISLCAEQYWMDSYVHVWQPDLIVVYGFVFGVRRFVEFHPCWIFHCQL